MTQQRYIVTARKYRPQVFNDLVAQEHVAATLKNAIRLDRLAHAYLFSGPRGVGKTTAARILAKAINCNTPLSDRADEAEPCQTCASCLSFADGRSLNVIEIDAASNNKVDDMRELRDTVRIPPQGGRKKVYIVDEVHMLSPAAFNALLKTLEEPPSYALFIFATTEPHKVIPTILSRCQRFDFRRIAVPEIVKRLEYIGEQEGVTADERSLILIARKGDGALRDALSAFDQAVAVCGSDISYEELSNAFRVVDEDLYFEVTDHALVGSSAAMLAVVQRLVDEGYDIREFLGGLLGHLRNVLVALTMQETSLIEATEEIRRRYEEVARKFTEADLLRMMMVVAQTEESMRQSSQPQLNAELGLLRLAQMSRVEDLRLLIDRLGSGESNEKRRPAAAVPHSAGPSKKKPVEHKAEVEISDEPRRSAEADLESVSSQSRNVETPPAPASDLFGPPALRSHSTSQREAPQHAAGLVEGSAARATLPTLSTEKPQQLRELESEWLAFVRAVKSQRIHVGALLQHTSPAAVEGPVLTVAVPDDFHKRLLTNQEPFLVEQLRGHLPGRFNRISFSIRKDLTTLDSGPQGDAFDAEAYMERKRQENPMVRALFEEFGGELVW